MIDQRHAPMAWLVGGHVLCAAHAEHRFGAALYREPLPAEPLDRPALLWRALNEGEAKSTPEATVRALCTECS